MELFDTKIELARKEHCQSSKTVAEPFYTVIDCTNLKIMAELFLQCMCSVFFVHS